MRLALALSLSLLVLLMQHPAALADEVNPADGTAIRQIITDQLAAFARDDGTTAFSYASPTIREKFGTPEIFMDMVRSGYRPVYRASGVEFRELAVRGGVPVQAVHMIGPDGEAVIALYFMERQPDGTWKINGCMLTRSPDLST